MPPPTSATRRYFGVGSAIAIVRDMTLRAWAVGIVAVTTSTPLWLPDSVSAALLLAAQSSRASECPNTEAVVVVDTTTHELKLCEKGVAVQAFRVALGSGGTGKTKAGDNKTPLGEYALGSPRPSARFGVFIPVGYPTKEQAARGLTGADIGIHGPDRHFVWLGSANLWFDWTAGCVAVGSDEAIQAVAAWVKAKRVGLVLVR